MTVCRTGCPSQDHGSYAECLRNTSYYIGDLKGTNQAWDKNLDNYAKVRADGIQPKSCDPRDIAKAVKRSGKS